MYADDSSAVAALKKTKGEEEKVDVCLDNFSSMIFGNDCLLFLGEYNTSLMEME